MSGCDAFSMVATVVASPPNFPIKSLLLLPGCNADQSGPVINRILPWPQLAPLVRLPDLARMDSKVVSHPPP